MRRSGRVGLYKQLVIYQWGDGGEGVGASDVETRLSMGINTLVEEQRKVTARIGSQQHSGGEKSRSRSSPRMLGNPCHATNFLGAR